MLGDIVLARRFHIAKGAYKFILQVFKDLIGDIALQPQIDQVQIEVIIFKLVDDIKGGEVPSEVLEVTLVIIRCNGAAGVQGIAERVNIKVAVKLSFNGIAV